VVDGSGTQASEDIHNLGEQMPYKSVKQERFFNANKKKIGAKVVDEFNAASKGKKLPKKAKKKSKKK